MDQENKLPKQNKNRNIPHNSRNKLSLQLEYKPTANSEDYYIRKGNYALYRLIFVDHQLKIC